MSEKIPAPSELQEIYSTIEDRFIACEKTSKNRLQTNSIHQKNIFKKH